MRFGSSAVGFNFLDLAVHPGLQRFFELSLLSFQTFDRVTGFIQWNGVTRKLSVLLVPGYEVHQMTFGTRMRLLRQCVIYAGERFTKWRNGLPWRSHRSTIPTLLNKLHFGF